MTKKKKGQSSTAAKAAPNDQFASANNGSIQGIAPTSETTSSPAPSTISAKAKTPEPSTSALIICRNNNYASPRPHPIDPAVFYDLVKIRRQVDEATNLAVRAASGVTSTSLGAGNGMLGSNGAAVLGLTFGASGGNAKMSRERKHRMRELATQKLSHAYHLDEIAASVATMQSASTLEDVANLVLQRDSTDSDAKYVHFFHEKIPSRMLAQCTSLQPLDEVIAKRPTEGAPLRTRAVTRIFKEDFVGATRDLSEALAVCRYRLAQHKAGRNQLELASTRGAGDRQNGQARDWRQDVKIDEEAQPSSLEAQLLFHRAGVYLTIACQYVDAALKGQTPHDTPDGTAEKSEDGGNGEVPVRTPAEREVDRQRLEARKAVKSNAKRALRDYISFLSHLDYTPGLPSELTEEFLRKVDVAANGFSKPKPRPNPTSKLLEMSDNSNLSHGHLSDALVPRKSTSSQNHSNHLYPDTKYPSLPPPEVYQVSTLFSPSPPANLPPYPSTSLTLSKKPPQPKSAAATAAAAFLASSDSHEAITYHPLLTDALHSLLLCHSLIQTSPKELLRHAHQVARLARVCDGYPIFLAARSPSRADWIEVVRRASNWIGLSRSWETLCTPAPLPGHAGAEKKEETEEQARERRKQEAIMEALADERVHDEASFQAAVQARERRAEEQRREDLGQGPKRWAQEDGKEYPISTDRAEAVARWVREAPVGGGEGVRTRKGKKGKGRKGEIGGRVEELEEGVEGLGVDGEERVEEEVE
ncbi:MAG: hypothetical protein M1836_003123 [Candelina mexicana]|nr:MAG: hypothetical protein M1836_003123 [Candelina mexicana]